jgi:hypothetical protein
VEGKKQESLRPGREKAGIFKTWKGKKTRIFKTWKGKNRNL